MAVVFALQALVACVMFFAVGTIYNLIVYYILEKIKEQEVEKLTESRRKNRTKL